MFSPSCLPLLIGSLPGTDHNQAVRLIFDHTPEIPLWPQLPQLPGEGMIRQFLTGFPGIHDEEERFWIDTGSSDFAEQMEGFHQDYLRIRDNPRLLADSRFGLGSDTAKGFHLFVEALAENTLQPLTVKGQVTGPLTAGISIKDQNNQSIIFDYNLNDILAKHLSLKAQWQVTQLQQYTSGNPVILFIDEPCIVSFGSSGFGGVTQELVSKSIFALVKAIHDVHGLAGIHICANGDWSAAFTTSADIISFDAYFYFNNFILYREQLTRYLKRGGMLAWGIVPTSDPRILMSTDSIKLFSMWRQQVDKITALGVSPKQLLENTFISPSCGTGSLPHDLARKVLELTSEVSSAARDYLYSLA